MLRRFLKDYLSFTRSERNGIILLISLLLILVAVRATIPLIFSGRENGLEPSGHELELFESSLEMASDAPAPEPVEPAITPSAFDPNRAGETELLAMGLDRFVVSNILKYREKGGRFLCPGDLKKIYGLKAEDFELLEPFILIRSGQEDIQGTDEVVRFDSAEIRGKKRFVLSEVVPGDAPRNDSGLSCFSGSMIDLNQADSSDLIRLPGIGPVLSGRIIKYRELLGGYWRKEQLLEVYQLTPESFDRISRMVVTDTRNIHQINVNSLRADSLPYHPYVSKYQFLAIIKYRDLDGRIERIVEIEENKLLPPEVYEKMKPYLTVKSEE